MITIIDYGMGNLFNVKRGFQYAGIEAKITDSPEEIKRAEKLVLPGVGAFPDAMESLRKTGLDRYLKEAVKKEIPLLGICLGMQLLFQESEEGGKEEGLGLFQGQIKRIPSVVKVPHMGWNSIHIKKESPLLRGISEGTFVYFVHSYYAALTQQSDLAASAEYGLEIPAVVEKDLLFGIQFHPEKSSEEGLKIYQNFGEL